MTIAEKIAKQFGNDGQQFDDDLARGIDDVCHHHAIDVFSDDGSGPTRYTFRDDSVLIVASNCWDLGLTDRRCWCMAEAQHGEHSEHCEGEDE